MLMQTVERLLALLLLILLWPLTRRLQSSRCRRVSVYSALQHHISYRVWQHWPRGHWLWALNYYEVLHCIVRGELRLTGPAMIWRACPAPAWQCCSTLPGLLSPSRLQQRQGLITDAHEADRLFSLYPGNRARLALILRFMVLALSPRKLGRTASLQLMGIRIDNLGLEQTLQRLQALSEGATRCQQAAFVNADCLNLASRHPDYQAILSKLPMVLPDGSGIRLAAAWFRRHQIRCNLNGTDLFPHLLQLAERMGWSVFLLGGKQGVADDCARWVNRHYPTIRIAGQCHGYDSDETLLAKVVAARPDLLLVGLGAPHQERWIHHYRNELPCRLALGVGGLFDYYSGRIPRAPLWVRELGLEWVFRLWQEPGRLWQRYLLGNVRFLWYVARNR